VSPPEPTLDDPQGLGPAVRAAPVAVSPPEPTLDDPQGLGHLAGTAAPPSYCLAVLA